jgi:hypothetical protein
MSAGTSSSVTVYSMACSTMRKVASAASPKKPAGYRKKYVWYATKYSMVARGKKAMPAAERTNTRLAVAAAAVAVVNGGKRRRRRWRGEAVGVRRETEWAPLFGADAATARQALIKKADVWRATRVRAAI